MVIIFQLIIAAVLGLIGYGITNLAGAPDPWPQVVGIAVFCVVMGVLVIVVDEDTDSMSIW